MSADQGSRLLQALVGVLLVATLTLAVANQGYGEPGLETGTLAAASGEDSHVTVRVNGMAFEPNVIEVPAGSRLFLTVENTGDQFHDLALATGQELDVLAPGESGTLDAGVVVKTVEGWCTLPGHRAMGMTLTIVAVSQGDSAALVPTHPVTAESEATATPTMAALLEQAKLSPTAPAELSPLGEATVHEVTLTVTETTDTVAPGVTRAVWTYNGTSPGPTLHGRVGDTFHITLVNDGSMGHSIDFHAGELAPDEPMRTIAPGESLTYDFTATRAGIWMYHCATMPMSHHIANGMFGVVVIEPEGLAPARSFVLVQSEMYLGADGMGSSSAKVAVGSVDVVAFNGRAFQYAAHPLEVRTGERVRVWVLDAGPNAALSFHVVGTQFDTVWTEGAYTLDPSDAANGLGQGGAQVLPLLAAQGGFVEFVAPAAGHYPFVNHQMSLAEKGAQGVFEVSD